MLVLILIASYDFSYNCFLRCVTIELLSTFASGFASLHYVVEMEENV